MAPQFLDSIREGYDTMFHKWGDPRTSSLPLMGSPFPTLFILFCYLRFVNVWGPNFMRNRRAFNLDRIIIVYNLLNVLVSAWLFYEAWDGAWKEYSYTCQPVDWTDNPKSRRIIRAMYVYFLVKVIELVDTVFFILRKKLNQASYLHIYHHTGMVMLSWGGTKWLPGGHGTFLGFINSFVHVVMYSYYLITALYPQYKQNIWWKKYITQMQMIQFAMIIIHSMQLLFRECDYPKFTVPIVVSQNAYMFLLFFRFYLSAYVMKKPQQPQTNGVQHPATDTKAATGGPKQS
ncbi:Hypothetical predicted protein [Cloeon dipterum]|uniref:Elongation of very long chain fatty acids protein n=1 Tax=Cloeon dipterum TaxID=197152 RepID=A0A8S1D9V4_9INSE|nr:Hypothetical predicted protein [Cloeon dipterum]